MHSTSPTREWNEVGVQSRVDGFRVEGHFGLNYLLLRSSRKVVLPVGRIHRTKGKANSCPFIRVEGPSAEILVIGFPIVSFTPPGCPRKAPYSWGHRILSVTCLVGVVDRLELTRSAACDKALEPVDDHDIDYDFIWLEL